MCRNVLRADQHLYQTPGVSSDVNSLVFKLDAAVLQIHDYSLNVAVSKTDLSNFVALATNSTE